jgi:GNAT superfamily N-acetyltransferase
MEQELIVVSDIIEPELERLVSEGLDAFNDQVIGFGDRRALAVTINDPASNKVLGGIVGRTSLGLLFLDLFYLPDTLRGSGLGTKILKAFEDEGRRRGWRSAVLYTLSFQASGFYEKNGWLRFGEIACDPEGTSRVFMSKTL